jgi:hypothetical protein
VIIDRMPGCCTSAILYSFGEHGEESEVTVEKILDLIEPVVDSHYDSRMKLIENGKRCIFAISVDPKNIKLLTEAGFKVIDKYEGVQGMVHIMTMHA